MGRKREGERDSERKFKCLHHATDNRLRESYRGRERV